MTFWCRIGWHCWHYDGEAKDVVGRMNYHGVRYRYRCCRCKTDRWMRSAPGW